MQRVFTSFLDRLRDRNPGRISLAQAFSAQGVTLREAASWSGIRDDEGSVVIAIHQADIRSMAEGFSCLLWSPPGERGREGTREPRMEDRLAHCRLATWVGIADGLVVGGIGEDVQSGCTVSMRVEKRQNRYWATWGSVAHIVARPAIARPAAARWAGERMPALAAV